MLQNRRSRRTTAAVAKRIKNRPGTGYTKRSAAKLKAIKTGWHRRVMIEMKENEQVINNVCSGALDKYL